MAGSSPLRPQDVLKLGRAAGRVLKSKVSAKNPRLLIVRDTRFSGPLISQKLTQGLRESGIEVYDAGIVSTPSAAYLVRRHKFHSGVVVSASHNPPEFNGIKFFDAAGCKWPDAWERLVEKYFVSESKLQRSTLGALVRAEPLAKDYENFLVASLGGNVDFSSFRLALDCSNGANSHLAPAVFRRLGAKIELIGAHPNGKNINVGCGSQHTEHLSKLVVKKKCHAGIAYDGDGDRVIFVDEKGKELDGDHILAILASYLKKKKLLRKNTVVTTVMANLGLKKALKEMGVRNIEVSVGDRYVSEGMRKHGAALGGEQSGHIIMGDHLPTGDGLLTSLHVLAAAKDQRRPFSSLASVMKKFPQVLLNVRIKERVPLDKLEGVSEKIGEIERILGDNGRVLVRYSGTEPLLRIMLEGPDKPKLDFYSGEIAHVVTRANGE